MDGMTAIYTLVMTTETADSSESELQPTSHACTDPLHSDGHKTRCPGLPARQDSLFQLLRKLSAGSLQLSFLSGIASSKVTHQCQTEARG